MTATEGKMTKPGNEGMIPKIYFTLLNQVYEIERKVGNLEGFEKIRRNIERMKDVIRSESVPEKEIYYEDPMGQSYDDTRNDLEAHIAGEGTEELVVIDVIKPIIRMRGKQHLSSSRVVQRGMVTVETKKDEKGEGYE